MNGAAFYALLDVQQAVGHLEPRPGEAFDAGRSRLLDLLQTVIESLRERVAGEALRPAA